MMNNSASRLRRALAAEDGFIVVATLWLLAGLAALATVASVYIAQSANALSALDAATQWEMLSSAGVELAAYQLSAPAAKRRPTHGGFGFRLAEASVRALAKAIRKLIPVALQFQRAFCGIAGRRPTWRRGPGPFGQSDDPWKGHVFQ